MTTWYPVEAKSPMFEGLDDVHVVFHGINKSGSKAMASVLRRALFHEDRPDDIISHYHVSPPIALEDFREQIENLSGRFVAVGHYLYGSLRPSPRRLWVTQFRHPLPRLVSQYNWHKNQHLRQHGTLDGFFKFSKYIYNGRGTARSQIMQLGRGFGRFGESDAKMSLSGESLYEMTIEAIERDFTAIALAERFEESIFTFAALLGIDAVDPWVADDRNVGRPPVEELTAAERDLVREVYHWDYRLYDWAVERFKEQCSRIEFGPSLAHYKEACAGQYKDRLLGDNADDAVSRWLTGRWRRENPEPSVTQQVIEGP